ncbi:MAG: helix-turn-helix domain-containing protein [Gloeomargarita sp. SKYG116]|nr:helix-turn-helix domain-containing protein [Gloeomargarita sp. SKYG116]MDW8402273.1 helix-turn-helix domain-containing protein [Gloeomargarita sp. SKYGB_i_bin116]
MPEPHPIQQWLTDEQWQALLAARAGRRIYIPTHPKPEHPLAPKHQSAWDRLRYSDNIRAEIRRLATQGMTREQIASKLKVSSKTVYRALRQAPH